ncbi:hypothetical protein NECAME_13058 [Necator americanus]|uniref:Uncharacterized protein n=1 Tax=Necator americanus TaxID=51031 RepID=W2SX44_NECAM|nr:hypothetical protein NECAME_13058 [Necator americanus]ETN74314.1 hypothetical protein NECAME_13058 [Necator americanus]
MCSLRPTERINISTGGRRRRRRRRVSTRRRRRRRSLAHRRRRGSSSSLSHHHTVHQRNQISHNSRNTPENSRRTRAHALVLGDDALGHPAVSGAFLGAAPRGKRGNPEVKKEIRNEYEHNTKLCSTFGWKSMDEVKPSLHSRT